MDSTRAYPDYYPPYNQSHALEYTKTLTSQATILHLGLWTPIQRGETTSIVLFYKIPQYAQKDSLGNFQFDFKTIIDRQAILVQNMRVAINVDYCFTLKGGESKVDYRPNIGFMGDAAMTKAASADIASPEFRQYTEQIRYAGGLVKTASNLDAFESFHVKGTYGENSFIVNFPESMFGIVIGALVLAGIIVLGKKAAASFKPKGKFDLMNYSSLATLSFASAVGIIILDLIIFFAAEQISHWSYNFSWLSAALVLLGVVVSAGAIFLPSLYVASKEGMVKGAAVFGMTLVFLIVLGIIAGIALNILFPPVVYYATTAMA